MTPGESAEATPMPNITQEMYASLPAGELVLFVVQRLHADGVPATVEEIVSACFKLFPRRFSMKNYFYWPDSAHVAQALKYAKEKGYVKDTPADGFILRPAGRQIARQAAKAMGIRFPMPPRVEKPKPAETQPEPEPAVQAEPKEAAISAKKKKQVKKVEKKAKPKQKQVKPAKKAAAKQKPPAKKIVRKKAEVKKAAAPAKKKSAPKPKAQPKKTVSKPVMKKKAPVRKKEKVPAKPAAKQLPLPSPAAPKKEAKPVVVKKKTAKRKIRLKVKKEAKPVAAGKAPIVSKEEKVKAGKVVRLMERSDAYRQYKKFGAKARISEFDFRNMLFATMESSAETLRRNVDLFKRYAGIHNRADLIVFLDFAEGSFAPLLRSQAKQPARKR